METILEDGEVTPELLKSAIRAGVLANETQSDALVGTALQEQGCSA